MSRTRFARRGELRIAYELRGVVHWRRPWLVLIQGIGFDRLGWEPVLPKLRRARSLVAEHGAAIWLQVDGGVHEETIEQCAEAGADVFVAGSAVFGSDDPAAAVRALRAQAERATAHAAWHRSGLMSLDY